LIKLGTFAMPLHPPTRPLVEILKENADKIILADKLGFDIAYVGEHYSCSTEQIASPLIFLAGLINQTKNIKLASGVIGLPQHHPAIVANEVALIDHMSHGRFVFGIGPGGLASDLEMFEHLDHVIRNDMVEESVSTILKIWASDPPYDIPGKYWPIKIAKAIIPELGIGTMSKPYQKPHPPIHISTMSPDGSTVAKAAKKGWTAVTANFTPEATVINHWHKYVEGCEAVGRKPTGQDWTVARNILVAESDAQAEDWLLDPKGSSTYYFDYMWRVLLAADYTTVAKPDLNMKDEDVTLESIIRSAVIWGSPKTVAEKVNSLRKRSGPFGTLLLAMTDGSGPNLEREQVTMRRLAEEVKPLIKT
jgi:alkanesulfonate monooxygenase SsuD/methylene tetrahydromethanopterin reductase-like flavin-dependent oxidoreductase (luciferase family)